MRQIDITLNLTKRLFFRSGSDEFMKASKKKTAAAARHAKRRLENPLTEAEKAEKMVAEAERQRRIQRTADEKCEKLRAMAKKRCAAGVEGLATEAT